MAARSSVRPLERERQEVGFIYVVLLGEAHDLLAARGSADAVLKTALLSIGMVGLLCLAAGLVAFTLTSRRPLRRLTESVRQFDMHGVPPEMPVRASEAADHSYDEIAVLDSAYRQMVLRISEQWQALRQQDQERRELIANVSHDLRTPLSSLHGYLETLLLKDASLEPERRRYLGIALDQSQG
jgi:signal transduction histidine kinase